jgi:hypothetical protein
VKEKWIYRAKRLFLGVRSKQRRNLVDTKDPRRIFVVRES